MDATQIVNEWLAKLNPGDAGMVLNQHGQCQLVSKDEQCIVFVPGGKSTEFHLFQDLAPLPAQAEARIYEEVLKLNLPAQATRGGSLGFDPQTRNLVFSYSRDIALTDSKSFCAIVNNFLDAAREIRKRIAAVVQQAPVQKARSHTAARFGLLNR
jgi:hypothetical protein